MNAQEKVQVSPNWTKEEREAVSHLINAALARIQANRPSVAGRRAPAPPAVFTAREDELTDLLIALDDWDAESLERDRAMFGEFVRRPAA